MRYALHRWLKNRVKQTACVPGAAYPTSGGLYFWSSRLAGVHSPLASWVTGWFNLLGQVAITAGIEYSLVRPRPKGIASLSQISGSGEASSSRGYKLSDRVASSAFSGQLTESVVRAAKYASAPSSPMSGITQLGPQPLRCMAGSVRPEAPNRRLSPAIAGMS